MLGLNQTGDSVVKPRYKDRTGQRSGKLVAIKYSHSNELGNAFWHCECDCGNSVVIEAHNFARGKTKSCGCLLAEVRREGKLMHASRGTKTYKAWGAMIQRCSNPNNQAYHRYGGRGIKIIKRWLKFENFLADMGEPSDEGLTLGRINNDGNYCKSNCRWETWAQQIANRDTSKRRHKADGTFVWLQ